MRGKVVVVRKRKMNRGIINKLQLVYSTRSLGATAVKKWAGYFQAGRESTSEDV